MAGLLKYFHHTQGKDKLDTGTLPDPDGPLSKDVSSSSTEITNTCVRQVQQEALSKRKPPGPYILVTPAQKLSIGKRAAENSITAMLRYYSKTFQKFKTYSSPKRGHSEKILKTTICCISTPLLARPIYKSYLAKSMEDLF